jgi:hypothetical protein
MKKICVMILLGVCAITGLAAQAKILNAMSLNGITGLYVVPTARLGWGDANIGFNAGYHMHFVNGDLEDLFHTSMSFFSLFEFAATYVGQAGDDDDDLIIGGKLRFPLSRADLALGANMYYNNVEGPSPHLAGQFYGVFTYMAEFFGMPADTTLIVGKTFYEDGKINSDIDFGMGFDLIIFPQFLNSFIHWIVDFSNYGSIARMSSARGSANTGLRIDISQIPGLSKLTFAIDLYLTDAFDANSRNFGVGITVGKGFQSKPQTP